MMNRTRIPLWPFLVSALLLPLFTGAAEKKDAAGFTSIFDGKTLDGWTVIPAKTAKAWQVEDGSIVGNGDRGRGYLVLDNQELRNFELKLRYRFPGKGNSGVSVRVRKDPTGKRTFQGYHADIGHVGIGKQVLGAWDFHTPGRREHACFRGTHLVIDENDKPTISAIDDPVTLDDIHRDGWNEMYLIVKDNHFVFYLNGKLASSFTEHLPEEKRLDKGAINLQLHDPGMIVAFKDIRLKITE